MSKYTTELRFICEELAGLKESAGNNNVDTIISTARPLLFNFEYPFFTDDENIITKYPALADYKSKLETKIISHYYLREIGAETVGIFKLWLKNKMREIMPYYNQLYLSTLIKFDPMQDTNVFENRANNSTGENSTDRSSATDTTAETNTNRKDIFASDTTSNSTAENTSNVSNSGGSHSKTNEDNTNVSKFLDTPQNNVSAIGDGYLTNITNDKGSNDSETSETNNSSSATTENNKLYNVDNSVSNNNTLENSNNISNSETLDKTNSKFANDETTAFHRYGKGGSTDYADLLNKFRSTFLNIDLEIIKELDDLFFLLW